MAYASAEKTKKYMRNYMAERRAAARTLKIQHQLAVSPYDRHSANALRDGSGLKLWPERRDTHPESIDESLKRVRR
jgi:hypothetical protein